MKFRHGIILVLASLLIALIAYAGNLNTSGKCPFAAACVLGHANTTTFTIQTDSMGNNEVVLPNLSIGNAELSNNSVTIDKLNTITDKIIVCGQDANSGTIYFGPATAEYLGNGTEFAIGGTACNALDNATEATADAPITADFPALKVMGMFCRSSSDATNDQILTLRSAAADLTPTVTCTIAGTGSATSCSVVAAATINVAAGATLAVKSVNTEDLSAQDVWCEVYFAIAAS